MEDTAGLGYCSQYPTANGDRSSSTSAARFVQGQTQVVASITTTTKQSHDNGHETLQRLSGDDADNHKEHHHQQRQQQESEELARRRIQERAEEGRFRAQAILRRFQEQQQALLQMPSQIIGSSSSAAQNDVQQQLSSVYVEQRRKAAIREKRRLQESWSKNFAYLAAKQDSETTKWEQKIAAAHQREVKADQHYQRVLEERKQKHEQHKELQSQAGIGNWVNCLRWLCTFRVYHGMDPSQPVV